MKKPCEGCSNTTTDGHCSFSAPEEICGIYAHWLGYQEGKKDMAALLLVYLSEFFAESHKAVEEYLRKVQEGL